MGMCMTVYTVYMCQPVCVRVWVCVCCRVCPYKHWFHHVSSILNLKEVVFALHVWACACLPVHYVSKSMCVYLCVVIFVCKSVYVHVCACVCLAALGQWVMVPVTDGNLGRLTRPGSSFWARSVASTSSEGSGGRWAVCRFYQRTSRRLPPAHRHTHMHENTHTHTHTHTHTPTPTLTNTERYTPINVLFQEASFQKQISLRGLVFLNTISEMWVWFGYFWTRVCVFLDVSLRLQAVLRLALISDIPAPGPCVSSHLLSKTSNESKCSLSLYFRVTLNSNTKKHCDTTNVYPQPWTFHSTCSPVQLARALDAREPMFFTNQEIKSL